MSTRPTDAELARLEEKAKADRYYKTLCSNIIESLAELEHDQWRAWSQDIASTETIHPVRLARWRTLWRPYSDLTEAEKEQDREWARKSFDMFSEILAEIRALRKVADAAKLCIWINKCRCDEAYTGRDMHEPNALCGEMDELEQALRALGGSDG
jgi:hypothetical protein